MEPGGTLLIGLEDCDLSAESEALPIKLTTQSPLVLTVRDSGHGMSPEVLARIFEPYYTTKEEMGGTGLGLATTHAIVTDSGGVIRVISEPGSGTTFRLILPTRDTEPAPGITS